MALTYASARVAPALKVSATKRSSRTVAKRNESAMSRRGENLITRAKANRLQESNAQSLVDATETFIFDCDGVIWKGDSLIEGVPETLEMLRAMGKRLIFVTNNSTKSRAGYTKKFESLGLTVNPEEIFSSSFAAAAYLESIDFKKKAYQVLLYWIVWN